MVTFRPVKKWVIPILAIMIGSYIGFSFLPSHQEFAYKQWVQQLNKNEQKSYHVKTNFLKDDSIAFESNGYWSSKHSKFRIETPVSNGSSFQFDVYLEESQFYIHTGNEWRKGQYPHRFIEELSPLDNPFQWCKEILRNADKITRIKQGEKETYTAFFHTFPEIELQGILLKKQKNSSLSISFQKGQIQSMVFKAAPIRPNEVPFLSIYPENMVYQIDFTLYNGKLPNLPKEASSSIPID
ncbi:hypothetical protein [Neobacillus sp. D3-1R]|uniref:hypothetical protein n=1 Tax=Neobacillus sp. D3-1R TaxID=3445778 RepID=UPI003FA0E319